MAAGWQNLAASWGEGGRRALGQNPDAAVEWSGRSRSRSRTAHNVSMQMVLHS